MNNEEIKKYSYGIVANVLPIFFNKNNKLGLLSMCVYRIRNKYANRNMDKSIIINNKKHLVKMLFKRGIKLLRFGDYTYFFNIYKVNFDMEFLKTCPIQNRIKMTFTKEDEEFNMLVIYNIIHLTKTKGYTSRIYKFKDTKNLVCYFRQGKKNSISITVREKNITDSYGYQVKLFFAWLFSKLMFRSKKILLYEKESNKYEESAAMLYEKLIDMGYNNAHFVINKESPHVDFIGNKYLKNIIWAHSFKHYLEFFRCKKFIGTESIMHVLELRVANHFVTEKLEKKKFKYVFLQHGVMYMVSLDSKNRAFFRKGNEMPKDAKIVVSSKVEADHFVKLGGFDYNDLYITGLPFYDRITKKETADRITIMPTWRPWDYNTLISDYENSSYYNMMLNIYNSVPEELKEKIALLPHPLVMKIFKNTPLGKHIPEVQSYDLILEDTALLITDYSSISYSAFYRGSNVIFVWNEKDECMKFYDGHLMLNEENVFGDYIYNYSNLAEYIKENYLTKQKQEHVKRYNKIVEFHDNKNTQRLIELLKRDKII